MDLFFTKQEYNSMQKRLIRKNLRQEKEFSKFSII